MITGELKSKIDKVWEAFHLQNTTNQFLIPFEL